MRWNLASPSSPQDYEDFAGFAEMLRTAGVDAHSYSPPPSMVARVGGVRVELTRPAKAKKLGYRVVVDRGRDTPALEEHDPHTLLEAQRLVATLIAKYRTR